MRIYNSGTDSSPTFAKSSNDSNTNNNIITMEESLRDFDFANNKNDSSSENGGSSENLGKTVSFADEQDKSNGSLGKSVKFALDTSEKSANGGGGSRIAAIKARLNDSFNQSWGGGGFDLDKDMSSSSEGTDGSSMGDVPGDDMDASENFHARCQQSFNASFWQIGNEDDDDFPVIPAGKKVILPGRQRRGTATARGSLFVLADDKLARTKVVQSRLEKAAIVMQRFFRRCLVMLRQYSEERIYYIEEKKDIEHRRREELEDIQKWIKEECEEFKMELEQEYQDKMTPEEWEAYQQDAAKKRQEIAALKEQNERLKQDCKDIKRENAQLAIVDPAKEQERVNLENQIKSLEQENEEWKAAAESFRKAVDDTQAKIDIMIENRKTKRAARKKMVATIAKIAALVEEKQATADPKLVKKVNKLKDKREKKINKLMAKTVMEQEQRKQSFPTEAVVEDRMEAEQGEDDIPPLAKMEGNLPALTKMEPKTPSKQQEEQDVPDHYGGAMDILKQSQYVPGYYSSAMEIDIDAAPKIKTKANSKTKKTKGEGEASSAKQAKEEGESTWERVMKMSKPLVRQEQHGKQQQPAEETEKKKKKDKKSKKEKERSLAAPDGEIVNRTISWNRTKDDPFASPKKKKEKSKEDKKDSPKKKKDSTTPKKKKKQSLLTDPEKLKEVTGGALGGLFSM
jgi:hypothetical protein